MTHALRIQDLNVHVEDTDILKDVSLNLEKGEIVAIMGPNGSGKSTLAKALMGHPEYEAEGTAELYGEQLLDLEPDERSQNGLFLSFQYPEEIPGVTVSNFLRTAMNARRPDDDPIKLPRYVKHLNEKMRLLNIPKEFSKRYLNQGFSGGEKKKMEILQLAVLEPRVAILDETDSGLDIDSLKEVAESLKTIQKEQEDLSLLIITHYQRLLDYIEPDRVCIMKDGTIVETGGPELAHTLEEQGYQAFKDK